MNDTGIDTDWMLTLEADYILSQAFVHEMEGLSPVPAVAGYEARFRLCIHGRPLRRSLYPGRVILFRRGKGTYYQDGHTQRLNVDGLVRALKAAVDLDDRKPISHWILAQDRYARLEYAKLATAKRDQLNLPDRIRTYRFLAPVIVLFYCLFAKRMIMEGLPGWYYTYQRVTAEILLSLYLMEERFSESPK